MSTGNTFVDAVIEHKTGYLGPFLCGALVQCIQTGIILDQVSRYFFTFDAGAQGSNPLRRHWERILVGFVATVGCFQTVVAIWNMFDVHVTHFGDWAYALDLGWADKMQPIVTMSMATPVQGFLIWRVVKALNRRWWTILPLFALQAVSVITAIITTVQAFEIDFGLPPDNPDIPLPPPPPPGTPLPFDPTYITYMASTAVLDAGTSSILAIFLLRSHMKSSSDYTRHLIRRLIFVIWQAALPPAVCALAGVFVYIVSIRDTAHMEVFGVRPGFWDLFFQLVLGKFYVISLLATVNGRAEILRSAPAVATESVSFTTSRSGRFRRQTQAPVTINVNVTHTSVSDEYKSATSLRSPHPDASATVELKDMMGAREYGTHSVASAYAVAV